MNKKFNNLDMNENDFYSQIIPQNYTTLKQYKSGGTIHIKKKNKGKFTDYCGGKVTDECIQRGKHSSNPAVRKRATFAQNARKWKHKSGGAFIDEVNVLDSNPSLYKHIKNKIRMHQEGGKSVNWSQLAQTGVNALSSIISANKQNSALKQQIKANNAQMKADEKRLRQQAQQAAYNQVNNWAAQQQQLFNSGQGGENVSGIVVDQLRNKLANQYVANNLDNSTLEQKNRELQQQIGDNTANAIAGAAQSLGEFGINALAKYQQPKSDFNSSAFKNQISNLSNQYSFNINSNNGTNVGFTNYMKQQLNAPTWTTEYLNFNLNGRR